MRCSGLICGLLGLLLVACAPPAATPEAALLVPPTPYSLTLQPSRTPPATATATIPPTLTSPPTATPDCLLREDWPQYTVAAGDTLGGIASRTGSSVEDLVRANCLDDPNRLAVGQALRVPALPADAGAAALALPGSGSGDAPDGSAAAGGERAQGSAPALAAPTVLVLRQFTASPTEVDRGGQVTLHWATEGVDRVTLLVIPGGHPRSATPFLTDQPASGEVVFTLPPDQRAYYRVVGFALAAYDASGLQMAYYDASGQPAAPLRYVTVRCPYDYFFALPLTLTPTCPLDAAQDVVATWQPFERGYMLWWDDPRQIYVLTAPNDDIFAPYSLYADTWSEGEAVDFAEAPPPGLLLPQEALGKLWIQNASVRDALGWATAPPQDYTLRYQTYLAPLFATDDRLYFTRPDGGLAFLGTSRWGLAD